MKTLYVIFLSFVWAVFSIGIQAADTKAKNSNSSLYVIFDGSNSMWGEFADKSRKITAAKNVFNKLDPALFKGRDIALRLYGHRRAGDCSDTELVVPFGSAEKTLGKISKKINAVSPRGKTPITKSLQAALNDFSDRSGEILLISDGIETCDADPCELVRSWRKKNINIRVHVVGLGLNKIAKDAMRCIAEASGTQYLDANSRIELAKAIEQTAIIDPPSVSKSEALPKPTKPQKVRFEFKISGVDKEGRLLPVKGTVTDSAGKVLGVWSNYRHVIEGGIYTLTVGVPTLGDKIFQPITQTIEIKKQGKTHIQVVVPRPATMRTVFLENGKKIPGVGGYAYLNGKNVFSVRDNEEHFIMPGSYDFTAKLNQDNDLKDGATIAAGEYKIIEFHAVETVRALFRVFAEGEDKPLRQHQQLLQNGELKYKVHVWNGADVQPGIYTLRSESALTPYQIENIEVTGGGKQTIERIIPVAIAKIRYVFKGDVSEKDMRCWLHRLDENGKPIVRSKALQCDGHKIKLVEGQYKVGVWTTLGNFNSVEFSAVTGQTIEIAIQEK